MRPPVVLPLAVARHLPAPRRLTGAEARPSRPAIETQLSKILNSDGFIQAKRMQQFLCFVVEETLAGRSNQLCEYSIGISVFGRDKSFNPGIDPIVRNDARRLRQKLLEYYQQLQCDHDGEVVIEIPKGGYVPVFSRRSHSSSNARQYRLTITLTRIADGAEIWQASHEY